MVERHDHVGIGSECVDGAWGDLPSASGSGDVSRECTNRDRGRGLRWARSTDADGEGDVRELSAQILCTGPLDFPPLIDGFVLLWRSARAWTVPSPSPGPCPPSLP